MEAGQGLRIENNVVTGCGPDLREAVIPDGVTGIGPRAFQGSGLKRVTAPPSLREVGTEAFQNCKWLEEVEFPSGLERLGELVFMNCVRLRKVVLPDTLQEMSWNTFFWCYALRDVELSPDNPFWRQEGNLLWKRDGTVLLYFPAGEPGQTCVVPDGIREIPPICFRGTLVREILLPDSVEAIRNDAMAGCPWLTELRLPPRLRSLGDRALAGTPLEEVEFPASLRTLGFGVLSDAIRLKRLVVLGDLPEGRKTFSLNNLGIPDSSPVDVQADRIPMKQISRGSQDALLRNFARRWSAGEAIPEETRRDRLEFLRRRQKEYRQNPLAQDILLSEKLVGMKDIDGFLEEAAAANNPELTARLLEYQKKYIDLEEKARREEKKIRRELRALTRPEPTLTELKRLWPGRVLEDGSWECRGYGGISDSSEEVRELDIPAFLKKMPVTAVAAQAFSPDARGRRKLTRMFLNTLTSVRLPDGIRSLGDHAFAGCLSLESVRLPEGIRVLGDHAFAGCRSLESVRLPEGLEELPESAFENCGQLKRVALPSTLKRIRSGCFQSCVSLEELELPEGLEEIWDGAFEGCVSLASVRLPRSLRVIRARAFAFCLGLTEVEAEPGGRLERLGEGAFRNCRALERVSGLEGLKNLAALPEAVFEGCRALSAISLPEGLQCVGKRAFSGCGVLVEVDLSGTHAILDESAFRDCAGLRKVLLPPTLKVLQRSVFSGCKSLESIELPEGLEEIQAGAFAECGSLLEIRLPNSLRKIGEGAFSTDSLRLVVASRGSWAYRWAKNSRIKVRKP